MAIIVKPPLKLGYGWVIVFHIWMKSLIRVIILIFVNCDTCLMVPSQVCIHLYCTIFQWVAHCTDNSFSRWRNHNTGSRRHTIHDTARNRIYTTWRYHGTSDNRNDFSGPAFSWSHYSDITWNRRNDAKGNGKYNSGTTWNGRHYSDFTGNGRYYSGTTRNGGYHSGSTGNGRYYNGTTGDGGHYSDCWNRRNSLRF